MRDSVLALFRVAQAGSHAVLYKFLIGEGVQTNVAEN